LLKFLNKEIFGEGEDRPLKALQELGIVKDWNRFGPVPEEGGN